MTRISRSRGHVFRDLGFTREEAENLRIRSTLMTAASQVIEERKWTQAMAAIVFGVTQPRVSDLVRGKIERFSIDGLIEMLGRARVTVCVSVSNTDGRKRPRAAKL